MLILEFHIPESHSLKERRSVVNSLKEKIRSRCNVAVIETSPDNTWQRGQLNIASLGRTQPEVDGVFRKIVEIADSEYRCELVNSRIDYYA
jgi:hypothetical protein